MTLPEFRNICAETTKKLADEKRREPRLYFKVVDILIKFLEDKGIVLEGGVLRLSKVQLKELAVKFNLRRPQNLPKGNCLIDILNALYMKNLYEGGSLPIPQQVERKTVMNLSLTPFEKQEPFQHLVKTLRNPSARSDEKSPKERADQYLIEFISSAITDGALTHDFHRAVMNIRFSDITLSPFSIRMPVTSEDQLASSENLAFFRFWLSPVTEMYFLRLVIFLLKFRKDLDLELEGDYVFPASWREDNKLAEIAPIFENWSSNLLKDAFGNSIQLGIRSFRLLSVADTVQMAPCFCVSAFRGQLLCDSLHSWYLAGLDDVLTRSRKHKFYYSIVESEETGMDDSAFLAEKIFQENKSFLSSNEKFTGTLRRIREIIDNLPHKLYKRDRIMGAKEIDDAISTLPQEGSDTSQKFLFNLLILGKWVSFLLKETKYDKGTIKTRVDTLTAKFIYMLENHAINELDTDQLIEIILHTYRGYDSTGISSTIRIFTDDLFDYQEAIFPEMSWESLPWGKGNVLYKEKIRRSKPLITFQLVDKALNLIQKSYPPMEAKKLRVALILGFYAGLRIIEISHLTAASLMPDGGYTLAIRESKTQSGTRNIRLALLLHPDKLREVVDFFTQRRIRSMRARHGKPDYLFCDTDPDEARTYIPVEIAKVFKRLNHKIRFHHLRHSFANWFLVRALAATRGLGIFPENSPFFKEKLFSDQHLNYIRQLLLGYGRIKEGGLAFAHIMPCLANIMGHYGPETTLTSYLHIVDWIYYLFVRKEWDQMSLNLDSSTVQNFMQLSYPSLPESLKKLKGISPSIIIHAQLERAERLFHRGKTKAHEINDFG